MCINICISIVLNKYVRQKRVNRCIVIYCLELEKLFEADLKKNKPKYDKYLKALEYDIRN